jgi:hypothetical protein
LFTREIYGPAVGDGSVISFVNGFLCTCSCDVAKAKRGVDPHPSTDAQNPGKPQTKNGVVTDDKGAVTYGGSLAAASAATTATSATVVTAASAVQSSGQVNAQTQGQVVNLLV